MKEKILWSRRVAMFLLRLDSGWSRSEMGELFKRSVKSIADNSREVQRVIREEEAVRQAVMKIRAQYMALINSSTDSDESKGA